MTLFKRKIASKSKPRPQCMFFGGTYVGAAATNFAVRNLLALAMAAAGNEIDVQSRPPVPRNGKFKAIGFEVTISNGNFGGAARTLIFTLRRNGASLAAGGFVVTFDNPGVGVWTASGVITAEQEFLDTDLISVSVIGNNGGIPVNICQIVVMGYQTG